MKFKLDENLGNRTLRVFIERGHDAHTVKQENLAGCPDQELFQICCGEGRCIVTLDLDFSNVLRFPPELSSGIAVLRGPKNPSPRDLEAMAARFLDSLERHRIDRQLWIVEQHRIRVHLSNGS